MIARRLAVTRPDQARARPAAAPDRVSPLLAHPFASLFVCLLALLLVGITGYPPDDLGAEFTLALELAKHTNPRGRYPVNEHVRRRQVELSADVRRAQIGDPPGLGSQPFPSELE